MIILLLFKWKQGTFEQYFILLFIEQMKTVKKFISQIENGYVINECILTKEWAKLVEQLENNPDFSEDWIKGLLFPYDPKTRTNPKDDNLVVISSQYFKKNI